MLFSSDQDQRLLSESLKRADDIGSMIKSLGHVIENHSPFALYIATKDRMDCSWIFDPELVCYMLGGKETYDVAFNSMFTTPQEREVGIAMFVMRKVGPLISLRLEEELLINIYDELRGFN